MVVIAAGAGLFAWPERPVPAVPAAGGKSRSSASGRIPVGVLDLVSVWFQLRFGRKPMLFLRGGGGVCCSCWVFWWASFALWLAVRAPPRRVPTAARTSSWCSGDIGYRALSASASWGEMLAGMRGKKCGACQARDGSVYGCAPRTIHPPRWAPGRLLAGPGHEPGVEVQPPLHDRRAS